MSGLFDFNTEVDARQSLKANAIHDVVFLGVENKVVGQTTKYNVLEMKFEKPGVGGYTKTIFAPTKPTDSKRQTSEFNGTQRVSPSNVEQIMEIIKQLISAVNPEFYKAYTDKDPKALAKWNPTSWDDMCNKLGVILNPCEGKELQIKLIAKTNGDADIPSFPLGINATGNVYAGTKIFGTELAFTKNEREKIEKGTVPAASRMPQENKIDIPDVVVAEQANGNIDTFIPDNNDLPF